MFYSGFSILQSLIPMFSYVYSWSQHQRFSVDLASSRAGLEKLTNANRSVSSVNDRLFSVELTEIADWMSMSEYMLRSNFGKP